MRRSYAIQAQAQRGTASTRGSRGELCGKGSQLATRYELTTASTFINRASMLCSKRSTEGRAGSKSGYEPESAQQLRSDEAQVGADIEPRNSVLDFVLVKRESRSSIASTVERGLRTLRSTQTRLSSSGGSR